MGRLIRSFKHKGLEQFFKTGSRRGVPQQLTKRLEVQVDVLNRARELRDVALPGFNLHPLKGDRKNSWAIKVNANWRIVFIFKEGDIYDVDFVDYHSVG